MRKNIVGVLVIIVIASLAVAAGTLQAGRQNLQTQTQTNNSRGSTSTSSRALLFMTLTPTYRLLAPGSNNNFTLDLASTAVRFGPLQLSAELPSGFTTVLTPSSLVLTSNQAVDVNVRAATTVTPGVYQLLVQAKAINEVFNMTFKLEVVRFLVLIGVDGKFVPNPLTVKAGSTVTWMNMDPGSDDYPSLYTLTFKSMGVVSPELQRFQSWTYTFASPGTYEYRDSLDPDIVRAIIVSA